MSNHDIVRALKEITKLKICYNVSSKAKGEISLNDCLENSPNLNLNLLKIALKFLYFPIAFCTYNEGVFLEIVITEEDCKFLNGKQDGTDLGFGS